MSIRDVYKTDIELDAFSPEALDKMLQRYRTSQGFENGIPSASGFDTYVSEKAKSADVFAAIKTPDGETFAKKLQVTADTADAVKTELEKIFTQTAEFTAAHENYIATLQAIEQQLQAPKPGQVDKKTFSPKSVVNYLHQVKADTVQGIREQHQHEKDALEKLFTDSVFIKNLQTSLGVKETDPIKKEMIAKLDESQKQALGKFEKTLNDDINKMHQAVKQEDRISYLATMFHNKHSAQMKQAIEEMMRQRDGEQPMGVHYDATISFNTFEGIKVEDIPFIQTITGRQINFDKKTGQFNMQLAGFFNVLYYYGPHEKLKYDITSLAQAIKACGHEDITMTISHTNAEHAHELGRAAYEACLKTGFDPKKITIEVNGKPVAAKDLFASLPTELKNIQEDAEKMKQKRDHLRAKSGKKLYEEETAEFKKVIQDIKGQGTPAQPADSQPSTHTP